MRRSPCRGCAYEYLQKKYCMDRCEMIGRVQECLSLRTSGPVPEEQEPRAAAVLAGAIGRRDLECFGNRGDIIAPEGEMAGICI